MKNKIAQKESTWHEFAQTILNQSQRNMNSLIRHTHNGAAKHMILFVHGFTGGPTTFSRKPDIEFFKLFYPKWTKHCDFATFQYHSRLLDFKVLRLLLGAIPVFGGSVSKFSNRSLQQYAKLLRSHVESLLTRYETVNFICHSMGGVLVKYMLVDFVKLHKQTPGFYVTLATPHRGVAQARTLSALTGNRQVQGLSPFNDELDKLSQEWELISGTINALYFCGLDDDIVEELAACPERERNRLIHVDGTHTSMCKPAGHESILVLHLNEKIPIFLKLDGSSSQVQESHSLNIDDVLFVAYRKEFEDFYLERPVDQELATLTNSSNVWINGKSGLGKTTLVQRMLKKSGEKYCFVDMSTSPTGATVDELLTHVIASVRAVLRTPILTTVAGKSRLSTIEELVNLIKFAGRSGGWILFIDEIPPTGPNFQGFFEALVIVANQLTQAAVKQTIRIVISTLTTPINCLGSNSSNKYADLFEVVNIEPWEDGQIASLLALISRVLGLSIDDCDTKRILNASCNSPRRLKTLMRTVRLFRGNPNHSIESIVAEALTNQLL